MRKKDDEKQKKIKEAVIKLTLHEGFHGASISKIAKEAGVSPATVYIYYDNKEVMLRDIYREYSEEVFEYLLSKLKNEMDGKKIIEQLIRNYYSYINENEEVFHFVDQFSSCPALSNNCKGKSGICILYNLLDNMKDKKIIKNYRNENIVAILFSPLKAIAINKNDNDKEKELIEEMIQIIQYALLV
ncbi:TetR/AcrR family transcriptional regulator [Clostridium sp. YIM B02551]|uniref:TetR/AcrR family transcriptional regulator n=1 Tax=Clostridium sp. YIM B02551 TaxID=2910679 RepID=UPI001EEB92CC|nr:TetR/AcrR family transcriptional regulator [Clostridium sp. YIM B02551]